MFCKNGSGSGNGACYLPYSIVKRSRLCILAMPPYKSRKMGPIYSNKIILFELCNPFWVNIINIGIKLQNRWLHSYSCAIITMGDVWFSWYWVSVSCPTVRHRSFGYIVFYSDSSCDGGLSFSQKQAEHVAASVDEHCTDNDDSSNVNNAKIKHCRV